MSTDFQKLKSKTLTELHSLCKQAGISSRGLKTQVVTRLIDFYNLSKETTSNNSGGDTSNNSGDKTKEAKSSPNLKKIKLELSNSIENTEPYQILKLKSKKELQMLCRAKNVPASNTKDTMAQALFNALHFEETLPQVQNALAHLENTALSSFLDQIYEKTELKWFRLKDEIPFQQKYTYLELLEKLCFCASGEQAAEGLPQYLELLSFIFITKLFEIIVTWLSPSSSHLILSKVSSSVQWQRTNSNYGINPN